MNCNEIKDLMSSYVDGELSENEKKLVEEHINSCDDCKKEIESYKQLIKIIKDLPEEEPPKGYCKRLHDKLLNEVPITKINKITKIIDNKKWVKYAGVAACLILVISVINSPFLRFGSNAKMSQENSTSSYDMAKTEEAPPYAPTPTMDSGGYGNGAVADSSIKAEYEATQDSIGVTSDKKMKIIKSSSLMSQTDNYDKFINELIIKINSIGGFVEQNNTNVYSAYETKKLKYGYLTLRIPEDKFYEIISFIEEQSEVNQKNISEIDKTKEYYDKDNQIKNLEAQEAKLRELFEKATTVQDMITIENELRRIRTEIDSLNMSLKDIDDRASLSTISLEVQEVLPANFNITGRDSVWDRAKEGFINTVNGIVNLVENILILIISLSPILIPFAIILIIVFIKIRKNQKNNLK